MQINRQCSSVYQTTVHGITYTSAAYFSRVLTAKEIYYYIFPVFLAWGGNKKKKKNVVTAKLAWKKKYIL